MTRTFVSIDGDRVKQKLNRLIYGFELEKLVEVSTFINDQVGRLAEWIRANDGTLYALGGDNLVAQINDPAAFVEFLRRDMQTEQLTFSAGIGPTPALAHLALSYAKTTAHGTIMAAVQLESGGLQFIAY